MWNGYAMKFSISPTFLKRRNMQSTLSATMFLFLFITQQGFAEVIVDGTLKGNSQVIPGPFYIIRDEIGMQKGKNIFHSFSKFNIDTGEKARFFSSAQIKNILVRVTDTEASFIDGEVGSPANLWLMNPAGWVIGQNAKFDINGSFHLSTANAIGFEGGEMFFADPIGNSVLSAAAPIDYQFNQGVQATITLDQADLVMQDNKDIVLMGGDIKMQNSTITAPGGRILLASNSGKGKWHLDESGLTQINGSGGIIDITHDTRATTRFPSLGSPSESSEKSSGRMQLIAEKINLNNAFLHTKTWDDQQGSDLTLQADQIVLNSSSIRNDVFGSKHAGNIQLNAKDLILKNESIISGNSTVSTTGNAGNIRADLSGKLLLSDKSNIISNTLGGDGGNIQLHSDSIILNNISTIRVTTQEQGGDAGNLVIATRQLSINDSSSLNTSTLGDGKVENNSPLGKGQGGNITVTADKISLDNGLFSSESRLSEGNAGDIDIQTKNLSLENKAEIRAASTEGTGSAGSVRLNIKDIVTMDESTINTFANETDGGDIQIKSKALAINHSEIITSSLGGKGNGGNIDINTESLVMNGGFIQANATAINARGGDIQITADNTIASQGHILIGGDQRQQFDLDSKINVIQAAAPDGISGQVNLNSVELNIAGQLAKVDSKFANRKNIADDPCSIARDEQISSLVKLGKGGLPARNTDNVNLPLYRHLSSEKKQFKQQQNNSLKKISTSASNVLCKQG